MRWEHGTEAGALVGTPNVEGRGEDVLRLSPETCRGLVSWRSADWTGRTYDVYLRNVRTARGVVRKLFFFFFFVLVFTREVRAREGGRLGFLSPLP